MTELQDKRVTTRKAHKCVWCGEKIKTGAIAHYRTYIFEDCFNADYLHPECYKAMITTPDDLEDGFEFGMFKRGTWEEK
jgi:hypothetical protein